VREEQAPWGSGGCAGLGQLLAGLRGCAESPGRHWGAEAVAGTGVETWVALHSGVRGLKPEHCITWLPGAFFLGSRPTHAILKRLLKCARSCLNQDIFKQTFVLCIHGEK